MEDTSRFDGLRAITPGSQAFRLARTIPGDGTRLERLLRKLDFRSKRVLADGSGELDARFDRAIARAEADETVDADQLNGALKTIDDLDGDPADRAMRLVAETDGAGVKLIDDLDTTQLRTLTDSVDSDTTLTKLSHQFDAGTVDSRHLDEVSELLDSGDMDGADLRRFSELLDKRDSDELIDDSIEADDLLDAAKDGDLSDTLAITLRNGNVYRLESGGNVGWEHIDDRHITGAVEKDVETTYFPTGQSISRGGRTVEFDSAMTERDVKRVIKDTIKYGDPDTSDPGEVYSWSGHKYDNLGEVRVVLKDDGGVVTAYPDTGSSYSYPWWDPDSGGWKNV